MNLVPIILGFFGLLAAYLLYAQVKKYPAGEKNLTDISDEIHLGAMAFMKKEYSILFMFSLILVFGIYIGLGLSSTIAFIVGALSSSITGFIGMYTATKANVRTATAAQNSGVSDSLSVAFFGGSIMGLTVAAMGLLGLLYILYGSDPATASTIHGFGMGASTVALFSRVGGGIFTKSADVGADLVGKVEKDIPEDDPRNPGVIADNVGDNVGDVAGMGSDIFESYCGAIIATIAIASTMLQSDLIQLGSREILMSLPLALASLGLFCSIIGILIIKILASREGSNETNIANSLRGGTFASAISFIVLAYFVIISLGVTENAWYAVLSGTVGGIIIGLVTEYYTGGAPVRKIAEQGQTGSATVITTGLSIGLQSVVIPVLTLVVIIFLSNYFAGLYGVGIAAVGMLATVGITMAIDAYGPIADNAGGIAEMGALGEETRKITDSLDEVGNTTAAIGKGFAIGAAALAALAIITAFVQEVNHTRQEPIQLLLTDTNVLIGLFIGGMIPFLVGSLTITAVGDAAYSMINEIRRQFRGIPGLLEGTGKPDNQKCVEIATGAALKKMVMPGAIAVFSPVTVGFLFGPEMLGGLLGGGLVSCILLALTMSNSGGAWDNAKKFVEKGNFGGKGSDTHKAAVVGDTVGDPLKDTSGPSMNILINVMAIVSLVIAPLL